MVGDKSEAFMTKVAGFVDEEMTKITDSNSRLSLSEASILTALNITELLFECSGSNDELTKENEELKKKVVTPDEGVQQKMSELEEMLKSKDKEILDNKTAIEELNKIIEAQKNEILNLSNDAKKSQEQVDIYKLEAEELSSKMDEANEKAEVAEKLASEFQNKAYDLQLKYTELKNKVNDLKE